MNPWELSASDLLVWGIVLHLIADWPLQNDWMANNKMRRRDRGAIKVIDRLDKIEAGSEGLRGTIVESHEEPNPTRWWDRHPAAYVHAGIHGILLSLIFGWAAIPLAVVHLIIDCRWIVAKWSQLIRQTEDTALVLSNPRVALMSIGLEVRFWTDQVFHIFTIAVAALLVTL
jgi:hypothetical protein